MSGLHRAFDKGFYRHVLWLLEVGSNPDCQDAKGVTVLMKCASLSERAPIRRLIRMLLSVGANLNILDRDGRTALIHAVLHCRISMVHRILDSHEVDLEIQDKHGDTVLHHAVRTRCNPILIRLLESFRKFSLSVDIANSDGVTPLLLACQLGSITAAQILILKGRASLSIRDNRDFKTPVEWLRKSGRFSDSPSLLLSTPASSRSCRSSRTTEDSLCEPQLGIELRTIRKTTSAKSDPERLENPERPDDTLVGHRKSRDQNRQGSHVLTQLFDLYSAQAAGTFRASFEPQFPFQVKLREVREVVSTPAVGSKQRFRPGSRLRHLWKKTARATTAMDVIKAT